MDRAVDLIKQIQTAELLLDWPISVTSSNNLNGIKTMIIKLVKQKFQVDLNFFTARNLDSTVMFRGVFHKEAMIWFLRTITKLTKL